MADYGYPGEDHPQGNYAPAAPQVVAQVAPQGMTIGRMANVLGALASLGLVIGVGVWSYKLIARDVSGVPVVRALEGPMRVQAANPGGETADHQGLAVNTVAATGTAAPAPDRLILAPQPVSLTEDDQPASRLAASTGLPSAPATLPQGALAQPAPEPSGEEVAAYAPREDDGSTLPEPGQDGAAIAQPEPLVPGQMAQDPGTTHELLEDDGAEPAQVVAAAFAPEPGVDTAPGLRQSLRPALRPRSAAAPVNMALNSAIAAAVQAAAPTREVDPDTLSVGTRLAQLGAYESAEIARSEWDRLYGRFGEFMGGKDRVIQRAESGGRTFYRLRAMGFADLADTRRFCSALIAENADCIPVTIR